LDFDRGIMLALQNGFGYWISIRDYAYAPKKIWIWIKIGDYACTPERIRILDFDRGIMLAHQKRFGY